jgi:hypothetical protein
LLLEGQHADGLRSLAQPHLQQGHGSTAQCTGADMR